MLLAIDLGEELLYGDVVLVLVTGVFAEVLYKGFTVVLASNGGKAREFAGAAQV